MTYSDEVKRANWESKARMMAAMALLDGVVLTITCTPTLPLKMGGHVPVVEVRLARTLDTPIDRGAEHDS
jgi:hypothetical protein